MKQLLGICLTAVLVLAACEQPTNNGNNSTALTGTVGISGTATVGETLTADTTALVGSGTISYRWERSGSVDSGFADIAENAGDATYTLVDADLGKYARVTVSRAGNTGTVSSTAKGPVAAATLPALSGTVTVTGTATVGEPLTAVTTALVGSGAVSYRWQRSVFTDSGFTDIAENANNATYTLVTADQDQYVRVTVSCADNSGTVSSTAKGPVAALPPGTANITIGFNYSTINITGNDGINNIYKGASRTPNSITLTASVDYTNVKWHIDGFDTPAGTGNSITLDANDYSAMAHSITFTGTRETALYSQVLPFTVKN